MLLFCGTRTLCSKNEETKVCVFFCVINSGKVEKWLTPILKGHVATCFGALFHKILVVIPWVYYVSLISPLSSTSDLEFVYQISHFFDLRISDTCSTCCVLPISCLMCFFYDIRCQVSLSVPLILNEQQRAAVRAEQLQSLNSSLRNLCLGNFKYCKEPLKLGSLSGNHFVITLRSIVGDHSKIEESLESLKVNGFINYFGLQRFGTTSVSTHAIGKFIVFNFIIVCTSNFLHFDCQREIQLIGVRCLQEVQYFSIYFRPKTIHSLVNKDRSNHLNFMM